MDPVVMIGETAFDAVHVGLALAVACLIAFGAWWRARTQAEMLALTLRAEQAETSTEQLSKSLQEHRSEVEALRQSLNAAEKELAAMEARQEAQDKKFAALANSAVEQAHKAFLDRADENFKHQSRQATGNLEKLVEPIGKTFAEFKTRIEAIEKVRTEDKTLIQQQVETIAISLQRNTKETNKLVNALTAPRGGGRWGEMTLRNVMEQAGLSAHCDFNEQVVDQTEDGMQKPDAVIQLPGNREIVVDAKVSLEAYIKAAEATEPEQQAAYLRAHADAVKAQVDRLASKGYQNNLDERVDFVAMFIPGENFFAAALQHMPDLLDRAYARNVIVTTPSTLIGLAKTVSYVWRQEKMTQNAVEAAQLGQELYSRVHTLTGHIDKLGSTLNNAVGHYNKVNSSLDKRVLPTLRKFEELSIAPPDKQLPDLKKIETGVTQLELAVQKPGEDEAA
ncbi:MAG: DNA recombination protein RmuC [Pseudomonadota bacterium]